MRQHVLFEFFRIFFTIIFLLCNIFSSSSQNSPLVDNRTEAEFANHTAISNFRTINRRSLEECSDPNPYLQIGVSTNSKLSDDEFVTVTITGVLLPAESDWVAMVSPAHSE